MIGWHCGKRVDLSKQTRRFFWAKCVVCKRMWRQKKRQPRPLDWNW